LSGGEKQCIGIARAMLKNAPIVVLDEPTSSMDAHTERLVMVGLDRLLQNRTGFMIAHRLATVMKADRVIVLDEGTIVESGSPTRLLADPKSRFATLARAQLISGVDESPSSGRHAHRHHAAGVSPGRVPRLRGLETSGRHAYRDEADGPSPSGGSRR
jgi:ABC-type multidrug transport system ATPase subunit